MGNSPICTCGTTMVEEFDYREINALATAAIPTGNFRCMKCGLQATRDDAEPVAPPGQATKSAGTAAFTRRGDGAMSDDVHVVIGSSGEYENYRTWPVAVFASRDEAEAFAVMAYEWCARASAHVRSLDLDWPDRQRWDELNPSPYDPNWESQNDTAYRVQEVAAAPTVHATFTAKRFRRKQPRLSEAPPPNALDLEALIAKLRYGASIAPGGSSGLMKNELMREVADELEPIARSLAEARGKAEADAPDSRRIERQLTAEIDTLRGHRAELKARATQLEQVIELEREQARAERDSHEESVKRYRELVDEAVNRVIPESDTLRAELATSTENVTRYHELVGQLRAQLTASQQQLATATAREAAMRSALNGLFRACDGSPGAIATVDAVISARAALDASPDPETRTEPERTVIVYQCDSCGHESIVEAITHAPRGCNRTNCNGRQEPVTD